MAPLQSRLIATRNAEHPKCVLCGQGRSKGLGLDFTTAVNGDVVATFGGGELFQGYSGLLHGGVTCSLLDAAMTNCLFAHGIAALTGEMTVRFLAPVDVDRVTEVTGRLVSARYGLFVVEAEMIQNGVTKAKAKAKFVKRAA